MVKRPSYAGTCLGILLGIPLALTLVYALLWGIGAVLITSDPLRPAEALVLLSGGGKDRLEEVVRIYRQVGANVVLLTKAEGSRAENWNADELTSKGIPGEAIHITRGRASSTYEEARYTRETLEQLGVKSALVITDPYHTFRARLIFWSVYRGSGIEIRVRAVQGHWYRSTTWMFSRQGWETTLSELVKLAGFVIGIRGD
ncbi:YdcF family protein [Thermanaerothrix sp. 4228-RoL]|uniref:YdcF family protein n=1 Tax=Thermanaerothrix solaris TaxID=3058434 RepID=A0ABU3NS27_9CHLR|nr:YdcF family protein [Thermanaerothrix sp. 4228-RoL]MDT8899185.1 YdcF family protein [Thermanaerothrix sp. 4228-RoL]